MKANQELPEELFDLISTRAYHELSITQKNKIDPYLSFDEYDEIRKGILEFQNSQAKVEIPPFKSTSTENKKPTSAFVRLLNVKIPLYQIAAIGLLLILFKWSINGYSSLNNLTDFAIQKEDKLGKPLALDEYPEQIIFNY